MSPREKHLAILSALGLVTLAFYYIPVFLYLILFLIVCCILWYYHNGELLPARLGLYPRVKLNVPFGIRRWLGGWGATGVSVAQRKRSKSSKNKTAVREPESNFGVTGVYRRESETESFIFSPRDFLMGSYIGKPESPPAASGRPRVMRNPREQLREKLSRPNHAVYTPNRRLSFAGEPPGVPARFTITPQRHYPLQQPGISSVGVLPPVKWDGFRKKSILSPRNSMGILSPVTVKIARPDHHSSPSVDHLSCAGLPKSPVDPCSRESVLKVLKESRKRNVEDEDRSFTTEQRNKRRRNDSGGSAHSAFEPLLPNGTPSQLVPKPGSLKRGMTSLMEESIMKRSRTSSISSGTGFHAPRGTPGTTRNPIHSSYSSTLGLSQRKKRSAPSPTMSSPGSSRSQTPEGASKRSREEEGQSPSSASSMKSDQAASEKAAVTSDLTPVPKVPVTTSINSTGSGGKRKRRIQLISSHRDDNISLPPPPELGYTITVKDLDDEKKAAINKIQKILETPEPEKSVSPSDTALSQWPSTNSTTTTILSSLLAAPLPTTSAAAIPVINLNPSPVTSVATSPAASSPLLEALKMKSSTPISSLSTVNSTTVVTPPSLAKPIGLKLNVSSVTPQLTPVSQPQSSSVGVSIPSAFTQLPSQVSVAPSTAPNAGKPGLFGLLGQSSTHTSASSPTSTVASTNSNSASVTSNPLLASGFKPIFAVTPTATSSTMSTPEIKPVQTFKPIFGATTAGPGFQSSPITATNPASTLSSNITSSLFGSISSTTVAPSMFSSMSSTVTGTTSANSVAATQNANQPALKSLFGNWTAPTAASTSSVPALVPNAGSTFQFGATTTTANPAAAAATAPAPAPAPSAATTSSSNGSFTFGATQPDPQAAKQKVFAFGQVAPSQNTTGASFGGFGTVSTAVTTAPTTAQPAFSFGKSSFQAPTTQSVFGSSLTQATFGSSPSQPPKPFPFGGGGTSSTTASNPAPSPFTFGAAAVTTTTSFVTPTKPAFGANSTGFAFGTSAAAAAPAAPSFGASSQTQSATSGTFSFGGAPPQQTPSAPAPATPSGFNFGAAVTQFGTPVSNNAAPQMGSFNFGAAAATDKPAFGTPTPTFGQSAAQGPIPFGTPAQGFNSVPFGASPTPSFSIGAGSKPSGARQRLQARRQHNRKK
ncbi:nuclear envelope pore membrane protein POM 121 [Takifugu rubripes]|uniref:POM121 transmembrane nucleoporin n=1 Tax=Takifugu rubripes TaxID=31033 RepID=A0A3B5KNK3_TAKRU|nr:nuclear envelope pore membrane protein POM 121 [Takifugu rubripes]